jgi:hypothetical protein
MVQIDDILQENEIGKGMFATVYNSSNKNKNKYALRIEHIDKHTFEKQTKNDYTSTIWREFEFANTMYKLYPDHFMKLYDYKFTDTCTQKHIGILNKHLPTTDKLYYKQLRKNKYCYITLWSKIDLTLSKYLLTSSYIRYDIYINLFIQVFYTLYLMSKHGYSHNDLHYNNIGICYTKKKYIIIFNKKIPTNGMLITIIDYGNVLHIKYKLNKNDIRLLKYETDVLAIINNNISFISFKKINKIKTHIYYPNISKDDYTYLTNFISNKQKFPKYIEKLLVNHLYKYVFFDKYEKQLNNNKLVQIHYPDIMLPPSIFFKILYNPYDLEGILKYIINYSLLK